MSLVEATLFVPPEIAQGLALGRYLREGSIVVDATTHRVVQWLEEAGERADSPDGAMLFGWRCEESPAIWCVDREGLVRLLEPGRSVLGPAIPAAEWLHDQLEDLAYAADSGVWPATKWLGE